MKPIWELTSIKEAATRPDFYNFLNVGLKELLFNAYRAAPNTYEQLVTFETSTKNKENYPSMGATKEPKQVLEGESYQELNQPDDDFVEMTNLKYGGIIAISEDLIEDDQTKAIMRMPADLGIAHKKFEDKTVWSILTANATCYDANALFSANHPGYVGGAAIANNDNAYSSVTLSAGSLGTALGMIALWKGHSADDFLDVTAKKLVVSKTMAYAAKVLAQSDFILPYAANTPLGPANASQAAGNVFRDLGLQVISSARQDAADAAEFYIFTDFPGLVFQWRQKLQLLEENANSGVRFERDILRWKSRARWVAKAINWRFALKVS